MKNKKIILGLGTITALGAMSVGFIACVKEEKVKEIVEEKVKEIVEEKTKGLSKLTEDQIKKMINEAGYSKLTKEEMQEIIKNSQDPKKAAEDIFNLEAKAYLDQKKENDDIRKNSDIGHFNSGITAEDVKKRINENISDKKWTVVANPNRDDIVGNNTKEVLKESGRTINDGENSITFKLRQKFDNIGEIVTEELTFNFFVGQKDLANLKAKTKSLQHTGKTKDKIVELLNKEEEFKNVNLTNEDFEIVENSKIDPSKTKTGKIKIKAKDDSKKVKGEVELTLETVKAPLNKTHIGDLEVTNLTTKQGILAQINKHTDFSGDDKNIAESDFDFAKDDATLDHIGKIKITPKGKTEGESFTIDIPKLIDLKTVINDPTLGELAKKDEASIKKALKDKFSNIDDNDITISIEQSKDEATITGKGKYVGSVKVTFTIATTPE